MGLSALAGCGESRLSKSAYEHRVQSAYARVQDAFRRTNVQSTKALADRIAEAQHELRNAADALDAKEPPKEVEKQNEELVEGMRQYADDLDRLHEAAQRGDRNAIETFSSGVATNAGVRRMAEAAEEMKFKGYDLGPIAND